MHSGKMDALTSGSGKINVQHVPNLNCKDSFVESGACGSVSEFDIVGTGAVYKKVSGNTLSPPPDARAHDQSRRQKTAFYKQR